MSDSPELLPIRSTPARIHIVSDMVRWTCIPFFVGVLNLLYLRLTSPRPVSVVSVARYDAMAGRPAAPTATPVVLSASTHLAVDTEGLLKGDMAISEATSMLAVEGVLTGCK